MSQPIELEIDSKLLLSAYASGVFPMGSENDPGKLYWVDPQIRGVLPLNGLHISRSLRKSLKKQDFEVKVDLDFVGTMRDCADRDETWINDAIIALYHEVYVRGLAHSVEVWRDHERIGGLYGVRIGAAFFGESMFAKAADASKIALVYLVARLRAGGFKLLDTQFTTEHLESLGALEVSRERYRKDLAEALPVHAKFDALDADASVDEVMSWALNGTAIN